MLQAFPSLDFPIFVPTGSSQPIRVVLTERDDYNNIEFRDPIGNLKPNPFEPFHSSTVLFGSKKSYPYVIDMA
ncbi:MAG: hypothetical protein A2157_13305 [Deltaproteobacteria bacterium RBG_16_47_11]|nr:MAG: hypothetical protein A2157_13305 [Deltaproteobacteria bacterium RBG_16_47_11]